MCALVRQDEPWTQTQKDEDNAKDHHVTAVVAQMLEQVVLVCHSVVLGARLEFAAVLGNGLANQRVVEAATLQPSGHFNRIDAAGQPALG